MKYYCCGQTCSLLGLFLIDLYSIRWHCTSNCLWYCSSDKPNVYDLLVSSYTHGHWWFAYYQPSAEVRKSTLATNCSPVYKKIHNWQTSDNFATTHFCCTMQYVEELLKNKIIFSSDLLKLFLSSDHGTTNTKWRV